ncbi:alanine--tRNA ligase [Limibacterium fermenti]|uniref:alanine--tRNA ligase n=1 Tax=Limibacterium fermenti TaxID=3229863 RepID=UPI003A6668FB
MMTSKQIRQSFKDFFASKGHQVVPSAPLVIKDDPTLMFTNAGMNQFKDIILGNVPAKYPRITDSQKCLRVSGKHNDLEEVGHDTYHHTMFEMLGNWSFGDYFKREAIQWAWEYLTEVIKIDKDRLYATVFEGSEEEGLARDTEAAGYWAQYLPADRIIDGNKKDNFWEMGDTGPCGPCSEIHVDIRSDEERAKVDGLSLVNKSHPQVIEIWNLVFMQYNRKADGSLDPLPAKVIDTGMGFERLCMAVQGKKSNYDTDIFQPLIKKIAEVSATDYGDDPKKDIAMRVVADHVRTIAFSVTDGQLPSNAKAGYVIRRILRRAVRYGYTFLDLHEAFMYKLIPALVDVMGEAYPELVAQRSLVEKVIREEEESFLRTLETGIRLLEKQMEEHTAKGETKLEGAVAFKLYDTYGFPLDLTELILREHGMTVDHDGFDAEMRKQKERARHAAAVETGDWVLVRDGEPQFVGYDKTEVETHILRYRKVKQKNKSFFQIVLSVSPFYAEMGGQVGDSGWLLTENGSIEIFDTKRENNLALHLSNKLPEETEGTFLARIDTQKRTATECNHTATHLMHEALREVLGKHVEQKGSYVSPESLRFDFSHFQKMTREEIRQVEELVTAAIRGDFPLEEHRQVPIEEAKAAGAMALFGEKYGDTVRTVRFGSSIELCGGTHISSTGRIGTFRIVSESAIAAGVRRIEAVTAKACEDYLYEKEEILQGIRELIVGSSPEILTGLRKLIDENEEMKKKIVEFTKEKAQRLKKAILSRKEIVNGVSVFKAVSETVPPEVVKDIAFWLRNEVPENMLFVAGTLSDGRPGITLMLSDDLVAKGLNAAKIIREAAKHIQGGGGGQPHFATAGGKNPDGLADAVEAIMQQLK